MWNPDIESSVALPITGLLSLIFIAFEVVRKDGNVAVSRGRSARPYKNLILLTGVILFGIAMSFVVIGYSSRYNLILDSFAVVYFPVAHSCIYEYLEIRALSNGKIINHRRYAVALLIVITIVAITSLSIALWNCVCHGVE